MRDFLSALKKKLIVVLALAIMAGFFLSGRTAVSSYALDDWAEEYVSEVNAVLSEIVAEREVYGTLYLCDFFDAKEQPSYESNTAVRVYSGQLTEILSETFDDDFKIWCKVRLFFGQKEYICYIPYENLAVSDERFLAWAEEYGMLPEYWDFGSMIMYALIDGEDETVPDGPGGEDTEVSYIPEDIKQFPESYQQALLELKEKHPNWVFVKMYTGIKFQDAVNAEMQGSKSLVSKSFPECCKIAPYDGGNWFYASEDILKYYMDPRNALNESNIFCFEQLTYNAEYHTLDSVQNFLNGTFMEGKMPTMDTMTYAEAFWYFGKEDKRLISPFVLAARVLQEQGRGGGSPLISGVEPGYEGVYNYFNIGATGNSSAEVIRNGLEYAKTHWKYDECGAYYAIEAGANLLADGYIRAGQDTLYLQKYNVNPATGNLFGHQYMQNISAPYSEGYSVFKMYKQAGTHNNAFVFKIPVFEDMPEETCEKPEDTTKVYLELPEGASLNGVSATPSVWIDGVECSSDKKGSRIVVETGNTTSTNAIVYKYNSSGVATGMYVWLLNYSSGTYKATYEPGLEDALTYHGFSIRITGKSGIRYKTGVSTDTRATLLAGGVDGYRLKEYGTLVMNNANRGSYHFVRGGEKVASGLSYGMDGSGKLQDKIFETVNGRYRFTAVFTDLPATQFKTEFAFRGYMVLNNGARDVTIYGPAQARSIYDLANTLISMKYYADGSDEDLFLRKIISDADSASIQED